MVASFHKTFLGLLKGLFSATRVIDKRPNRASRRGQGRVNRGGSMVLTVR